MGPVTLCDEVGLDVAVHVAATLNADPTLAARMCLATFRRTAKLRLTV